MKKSYYNPPQDGAQACFGPLNLFACAIKGPKTGKMALMYKKLPMGGAVYISWCIMNLRPLSITWAIWRGFSCSPHLFWTQNRLNPLQIARVMETAALISLRTGTYKLHPPLIVILSTQLMPVSCGSTAAPPPAPHGHMSFTKLITYLPAFPTPSTQ